MSGTQKPIVVVGSINIDLVARSPQIALAGQTLIGSDFTTTPGGKGANQAVAAARLGYPVRMVGAVGEDVFAQALVDNLAAAGVETAAVARVAGPSGVAHIQVADSGENSIIVVRGANAAVTTAAIDAQAELIRKAGIVLCQLELPMETMRHTLALCAEAGIPVVLDPAPAAPLAEEIWGRVAWFTPNETEAALYVGDVLKPEYAAQRLLAKGLRGVVLKRGSDGAYVAVAGGRAEWIRSFCVEALDTVAAGDCFNGAFAVALMEGKDPWDAARFASAAAAISVTRRGAQASMPTRGEVERFLAEEA